MFYREVLRRVGKVRSEILIINLYRSWEWRALLRVEKVEKKLIGKKAVWKSEFHGMSGEEVSEILSYWSFSTRGNWNHTKFLLIMVWWDPNPRLGVTEVNGKPQCHSSLHRASSYGSISLVYSNREGSQKCYFVKNAPLIQCWKNYTNTPTENLHILNPFWSSLCMLLLIFNSLHADFF